MASVQQNTVRARNLHPMLPRMRFGSDRRLQEVKRILQTEKIRTIVIEDLKNAR